MEATADHPFSDLRMKPVRQKIWLPDAALHLNCAAVSGLFPAEGRGHGSGGEYCKEELLRLMKELFRD